jgi:predicted metal-dependent HD superfamily phosphohydrolase
MRFQHDYYSNFFDIQVAKAHFDTMEEDFFKSFYAFLVDEMKVPSPAAMSIQEAVFARMIDETLHYHTPVHVLAMFQFYEEKVKNQPGGFELNLAQKLAIWFHDSVYYFPSKPHVNESASVSFMDAMMCPFDSYAAVKDQATQIIIGTGYHLDKWVGNEVVDQILDLDLNNFSLYKDEHRLTSQCVKQEALHFYSKTDWENGRKQFLEKFLTKGFIYRTTFFREHFEKMALENARS